MSVLETLLRFAVPVVGIYFLVSLAVVGTKKAKRRRYRVGEPWDYEPLWWTANPEGAHLPAAHARSGAPSRARGRRPKGRYPARRATPTKEACRGSDE